MNEGKKDPSLEDLDAKLSALKSQRDEEARKQKAKAEASKKSGLGAAWKISSELVAAVIVGSAIGYGLDYVFGTSPLMLIIFILFGCAAGILNVFRAAGVFSYGPGHQPGSQGSKPGSKNPEK